MSEIKISIVVPVYNTEKYLEKCLDSCINQTLKDIEIIAVNDCSKDNSLEILEKYQKRDKRIKIISHEKNRGLFEARKTGSLVASGKYIQHLDSDDWLDVGICKKIFSALEKNDCDLCHFGTRLWQGEKNVTPKDSFWKTYKEKISVEEFLDRIMYDNISHGAVTLVAKNELVKKAFKNIGKIERLTFMEDFVYTSTLASISKNCICIPSRAYNYRLNIGTGSAGNKDAEKFVNTFKDSILAFSLIEKIFDNEKNKRIKKGLSRKKQVHYKQYRIDNWNNLDEKNKKKALELLKEKDLLKNWIEILFEYKKFREVKYFFDIDFELNESKNNKKIAFYINRMYNGGREKVVQLLANNFSDRGWRVFIFTLEEENENDYKLNSNIKRFVLPKKEVEMLKFFVEKLDKFSIDLVASHNWLKSKEIMLFAYLRLCKKTVCYSDHSGFMARTLFYDTMNIARSLIDSNNIINATTCLSRIDTLTWRYFGHKTAFLPNPIENTNKNNTKNNKEKNKEIVWIGRLEKIQKQTHQAIKAFSLVYKERKDIKLLVIGSENDAKFGDYYKQLVKLCKELGCVDGVEFVGHTDQVPKYLKKAQVHWLTSKFEGFPMVWVEARSFSVPTITYNLPWVELNGKGSIVVPQDGYRELAEETLKLFEDRKQLEILSKDAEEYLKERFNSKVVLDRWEKFYREMISQGRSKLFNEEYEELSSEAKQYFLEYLRTIIYKKPSKKIVKVAQRDKFVVFGLRLNSVSDIKRLVIKAKKKMFPKKWF